MPPLQKKRGHIVLFMWVGRFVCRPNGFLSLSLNQKLETFHVVHVD